MPELIRPAVPTALSKEEVQRVFRLTNDNLGRVNERLRGYDYALTHGVELQVEKPVSYTVSKALAVRSYDESTGAEGLPVESLTVREVNATTLGITAYFRASVAAGESSSSAIASGSAVALSTTNAANITSLNLTAGEWDVSGLAVNGGSPTGFTEFAGAVNTTSANIGTSGDNQALCVLAAGIPTVTSLTVPAKRFSLSATTAVYLVARAVFTGGTCTAYGRISATRAQNYTIGLQNKVTLLLLD